MTLETDRDGEIIEHLRRENASLQRACDVLNNALKTVDFEVDKAARKYLSSTVQTGHLKFSEFMELLVREVKVTVKREIRNDSKVATALKKDARDLLETKMDAKIEALIPVLKGRLTDYITIRVVVLKKATPNIPFARYDPDDFFYAMPIRGSIKQGVGISPEKAYADLREKLVLNIFELGPKDFIHSLLMTKPPSTLTKFEEGRSLLMDDLEGFKVDVRFYEEKPK